MYLLYHIFLIFASVFSKIYIFFEVFFVPFENKKKSI
nr:MAG TPA: hypothetical protein [Caudoviricetes sp.]